MAGQRQPIELLISNGKKHLTKKEIEERKNTEIKAKNDNIAAPDYLTAKQKKEFEKISEELMSINIMTNLDCDLLARFIISNDLYIKFTKKLKTKEIQEDILKMEKIANLQDKYFKQCMACSKEMGLTISSRCKIAVPKQEQKENALLEALNG